MEATKRKYILNRQRVAIAEKHEFRCFYCFRQFDKKKLLNPQGFFWITDKGKLEFHIDHKVPLSKGGLDDESNMVFSCAKCNLSKSGKLL
jgi:5-methylcytosine-specific restriction endonuclease McrA